ncbi:hypothetical protein M413DRAFT_433198 [Hebeloma cylindrosporum]|uniref:Uncharacterized protein n=1 Tax=Hebeloma cylindrosporum TaxID=76867 RepID=A0A0C3C528_HEBCY|nr:hypothetical protein M413DRAFT_433198 [Hebeloma cylindrosporum h7]
MAGFPFGRLYGLEITDKSVNHTSFSVAQGVPPMHIPTPNRPSAMSKTLPSAAASQCSQYISNNGNYGGGQYYAHPPPRSVNAPRQGQQVHVREQGATVILEAVVLQDASPNDQSVWIQINGQTRRIPNDPTMIW